MMKGKLTGCCDAAGLVETSAERRHDSRAQHIDLGTGFFGHKSGVGWHPTLHSIQGLQGQQPLLTKLSAVLSSASSGGEW